MSGIGIAVRLLLGIAVFLGLLGNLAVLGAAKLTDGEDDDRRK